MANTKKSNSSSNYLATRAEINEFLLRHASRTDILELVYRMLFRYWNRDELIDLYLEHSSNDDLRQDLGDPEE